MSPRTVAALGVVFCLLLAAVLASGGKRGDRTASAAGPLILWAPSAITGIRSEMDGRSIEIERGPGGLVVSGPGLFWPADARTASAGLRLLATASAEPHGSKPETLGLRAEITAGAESVALAFGSEQLSGQRVVVRDDEALRTAGEIGSLLEPGSLRSWASPLIFPGVDPSITSIRLANAEAVVELARVGSRWGLTNPVRTAADPERVAALIASLATAEGQTAAEDASGSKLEIEIRGPGRSWSVACDHSGVGIAEASDGEHAFRRAFSRATALAQIVGTDPASLVSGVALDVPASDVQRIEIALGDASPAAFVRDGRGWMPNGTEGERLLAILTGERAGGIEIGSPPAGAARLRVSRFGDLPAGEFAAWIVEDRLFIHDGAVTRRYQAEPALLGWFSGLGD